MIFKPELARLVIQGKKTATRRIANGKPCPYQVGNHYAVQPGRGKPAIGRITIVDVERQALGALGYTDVRAEGFHNRADFARYWMRLHERGYEPNGASADELVERWLQRHGETDVWVITFERKRSLDLLLPPAPPLYLHRVLGVTTDPGRKVPGEPEVPPDELRTRSIAVARRKAERAQKVKLQEAHELVDRARTALAEAVIADLDIAPDLELLERQVQELELKLRAA